MKDLHKVLLKEIANAGSQSAFAAKHKFSRAYVSDLVLKRRNISPQVANILGYKMTVTYKRIERIELKKLECEK